MDIKRDFYLEELKAVMHNGLVKVITVIRMWPLSFAEYYAASGKEKSDAWEDYLTGCSHHDAERGNLLWTLAGRLAFPQ